MKSSKNIKAGRRKWDSTDACVDSFGGLIAMLADLYYLNTM